MNRSLKFFILLKLLVLAFLLTLVTNLEGNIIDEKHDGDLTIHISNIKKVEGQLQIGIYNNKSDFPKIGREFKKLLVPVKSNNLEHKIEGIPEGYYAIAVYHDVNVDEVCNKNFIGIPIEAYGFSNNAAPVFSAPSFKATRFSIPSTKDIYIKLRH